MKKRGLLITFAVILCSMYSVAQDKRVIYEKLVDYVNCKYAIEYIDKKKSEISRPDYIKDFEKYKNAFNNNVKSFKDITNGIDKKVQNSTSVYDALKKSANGFPKAKALWKYVDQKKAQYSENWTEEQMIDLLILLTDDITVSGQKVNFKSFLSGASNSLKVNLIRQIPDVFLTTNEKIAEGKTEIKESNLNTADAVSKAKISNKVVKNDSVTNQEKGKNDNLRSRDTNKGDSKFPFGLIFFVVVIVLLGYFGYTKRESIEKLVQSFNSKSLSMEESKEIDDQNKYNELLLENKKLRDYEQQNSKLLNKNKELQLKINELVKIIELERQNLQKWEPIIVQKLPVIDAHGKEEKQIIAVNTRLYADAIIGGEFHRISEHPNEDTVYELLKLSSARIFEFTVYAGSHKRVIDTPDFVDGCEKQRINNQPQEIQVEPGEAILDEYGKWKVTKKANIKFI